jgi:hypothetical protein
MGVCVMKSYARIENNTVVEIIETDGDIATLFHPSLEFMDCTNIAGVEQGWVKANGTLTAPPGPDLDELKKIKITEITAAFNDTLAAGFMTTHAIKMDAQLEKIQLLKSAYDLMVLLSVTEMPILVDYDNAVHANMPMNDVIALIIELGINYQTQYAKKQVLRGQAMAAANENEVNLITW